jgi:hypothetical protein
MVDMFFHRTICKNCNIINTAHTKSTMLDITTRGSLDKIIDEMKGAIPIVKSFGIHKSMQVQKSEDYALGLAIGYIMGRFLTLFTMFYNRYPDEQELKEAREVILNRTAELREAIFKAG